MTFYENAGLNWSKGRLLSHLVKLLAIMQIDPTDGSVELELQDTVEILERRHNYVVA